MGKKIIVPILSVVLVLSLAACGSSSSESSGTTTAETTIEETTETEEEIEDDEEAGIIGTGGISSDSEEDFEADDINVIAEAPYVESIETRTETFMSADGEHSAEATYEEILIKHNAPEALKNAIAEWNESEAAESKEWVDEESEESEGESVSPYSSEFTKTVTLGIDNGRYLSLLVTKYETSGSAHGSVWFEGVTFDAQTGEKLALSSMVSDYQAFKQKVVPYIEEELQDYQLFDDADTTIENEWDNETLTWYLSDEGLTFAFANYEIAPYSTGTIIVTYPMDFLMEDMEIHI